MKGSWIYFSKDVLRKWKMATFTQHYFYSLPLIRPHIKSKALPYMNYFFGVLSKVCMERSVCLYLSCIITLDSLVTAVPFPLVSGLHREEVCCPLVLYSLWEPQQDSVVEVPRTWVIRRPEGKGNRKWMSQVYLEQLHCEPKWHKENLSLWLLVGGIFTSHHPLHTEIFFLTDHFT